MEKPTMPRRSPASANPRSTTRLGVIAALIASLACSLLATAPAHAATVTVNPLAGAGGFTVVSFGDIELSNHEIEGSIAAAGTATTSSSSPYNIVHAAAGSSAYTLPVHGGAPVRLVLGGGFDAAGATNMIRVSSSGLVDPATQAGRLVIGDATGLSITGRGSGVCVQAAGVTDCSGAVIEQSNFAQSTAWTVDATAFDSLIPAQSITDLRTASDRIAAGALANTVTTPALAGSGSERELTLVAGSVNVWVLDPATLPTGDWKLRFGTVKPSATTPLVIRVQAASGATVNLPMETIGAYDAPGSSTNNAFAPYMLWNIEQAAGSTINLVGNGIIPGSFLAPRSHLVTPDHSSKTLIEGQVVAQSVIFRHQGEVHHYGFTPGLDFTVTGSTTGGFELAKAFSGTGAAAAVQAGSYSVEYAVNGGTPVRVTLAGSGAAQSFSGFAVGDVITFAELTPPTISGVTWTTRTFSPASVTIGAGTSPRVTLTNGYTHASTGTLTPSITSVAFVGTSTAGAANGEVTAANRIVTDVVSYDDLTPSTSYALAGELVYLDAGRIVSTGIVNSVSFTTPAAATAGVSGAVDSVFTIPAADIDRLAGRTIYIFQTLTASGTTIAHDGATSASDAWFSTTREWFTIAAATPVGGEPGGNDPVGALSITGIEPGGIAAAAAIAAALLALGAWMLRSAVMARPRPGRHRA